MTWFILVLLSALTSSLARIFQKILLQSDQSDPAAFGVVFQLAVAMLFFSYALLTGTLETPRLSGVEFNLIFMAFAYALANLFTFSAFKLAQASEVAIIFTTSTIWGVVAAVVMLGEKIATFQLLGIAIIIIGLIIINYQRTKWQLNKGHLYALLAAFLYGIAFTNDVFIMNRYISIPSFMAVAFTLPAFAILLLRPKSVLHIPYYFKKFTVIGKLVFCAFLIFLSAFAIYGAYKLGGPASLISPISQSSLIFTVIFSYIILRERDRLLAKGLGVIFTLTGVLMLI